MGPRTFTDFTDFYGATDSLGLLLHRTGTDFHGLFGATDFTVFSCIGLAQTGTDFFGVYGLHGL